MRSPELYSKFSNDYLNGDVKRCLNPPNNYNVDVGGLGGRQITCYEKLEALHGEYYPLKDYQADNVLTLRSQTTIDTRVADESKQRLKVYAGAEYHFIAGQEVELSPGFEAEYNSEFSASIAPCTPQREGNSSAIAFQKYLASIDSVKLPIYMPLNLEKLLEVFPLLTLIFHQIPLRNCHF